MNYYEILGVNENASKDDIKNAYRKLAKVYHPDKNNNDSECKKKFQDIQEAYETLSDDNKKQQYDFNRNGGGGMPIPPFFNNFPSPFPFNVFNMNTNKIKKNDEVFNFKIRLDDVFYGLHKNFKIKKNLVCDNCKTTCLKCNGVGSLPGQRIQIGPIVNFFPQMCSECKGSGVSRNNKITCVVCNSSGITYKEMDINLYIPKGTENGKQFLYEGWGEQAVKENEISGDFIIRIDIENHSLFSRKNQLDLVYTVQVNLFESIVGKTMMIPLFNETFQLDTRQFGVINPNKEYVIVKKGLYDENNNRGNLLIKFEIIYENINLISDQTLDEIKNTFSKLNLI